MNTKKIKLNYAVYIVLAPPFINLSCHTYERGTYVLNISHCIYMYIGSPMVGVGYDFYLTSYVVCFLSQSLNWLQPQTMGDPFYHIFE